jgi:hypothetical protein
MALFGAVCLRIVAHHPPQITFASQPINFRRSVCMGVVLLLASPIILFDDRHASDIPSSFSIIPIQAAHF